MTMEAIVIAATRVIERDGLERLNTTRIAEVAGVSVGSLYQYFANREAIIGAVIDRQLETMLATFRGLVTTMAELPLEASIAGVLLGLLETSRVHEKLHAPLYREMSAAGRTERHARTIDAYVDIVATVLEARTDVTVADPRAAAELIVHASVGVVRALVEIDDAASTNVLIEEAVRMIARYLAPM